MGSLHKIQSTTLAAQDSDRLQVLHNLCVLDTPPEPLFDHLTSIGAALFDAPIVLISLLDKHRQYFKSSVGLSITETPRDISFCAHTILSAQPMVIVDTLADPRFATNPLVTGEPHIRFYAGAPLMTKSGAVLGSYCVIDRTVRKDFSAEQLQLLTQLAELSVNALEQRLYPAKIASIEGELLEANERYDLATQATTEGIWDWNCATDELYKSGRMRAIVGLEAKAARIPLKQWLNRVHPSDRAIISGNIARLRSTPVSSFETEYRAKHEDGTWRWLRSRAIGVRSSTGELIRVVGSLADITEHKFTDGLTGLHTRASLLELLDQKMRDSASNSHVLLVIDLDLFKGINSSLGRDGGDSLLNECAKRFEGTLAQHPSAVLSRTSRDEFAIWLPSLDEENALMYANLLQGIVQAPFSIDGQQISLTASIGVAVVSGALIDGGELLHQAEAAAHRSKLDGGASAVVFTPSMQEKVLRRLTLFTDLRDAIHNDSLSLHYQPKLNLKTGEIRGFEALARWNHPVYGYVPPDEFIAIAEEGDMILALGRWSLREAIRQLAEWRSSQLISPDVTMAVNLSVRQFTDGQLVENLQRKLSMYKLPATCLSLEVTEGVLIVDVDKALDTLRRIRELGVHLDLDDFGTGYSSLSYLQRFPFDSLKVDRSFVKDMDKTQESAILVKSIIALAHALNLKVVAEGIETDQHLKMLRKMGCDTGQGYFFSKPLSAREMEGYLRSSASDIRRLIRRGLAEAKHSKVAA